MSNINVLTIFPDIFSALNYGITNIAMEKGLINLSIVNIRDFANNKHKNTDDYPYGGGKGMIMTCQPVIDALSSLENSGHVIYVSPKGNNLTQEKIIKLNKLKNITIICGRYEGIDQRIIDEYVNEEISIGDYVLSGGEIPAMVLIDSLIRLKEGVLDKEAYENESHYNGLLEYEQYTRPENYEGMIVPKILLSGNHKLINDYQLTQSLKETFIKRIDLLIKRGISKKEALLLIDELPNMKKEIQKLIKE
ncbi:MAG: tRNA (guanosine(37)-N1)-methyltransferase TrmD [Clostridiales bacterium]|nr:tRNA (guanosine(37)-N1)-methyltransferase TrmD [Clostridiales bacterium]